MIDTPLARHARIEVPLLCGAMYPCSNPELVAAVSAAGGLGVVQPVALTFVHGWEYRAGLRRIAALAGGRPIGLNALIEASSRAYHERMVRWLEVALEEGVRFVVTSLGNPRWVVERVHAAGGVVYHDVTERRWADKARDAGVDGLIAVNRDAGGHAGSRAAEALLAELAPLGLPVVAAGGVATPAGFTAMLGLGYAGVQMGTRFIATPECTASDAYKAAIVRAGADDIVLSERITGVPVAVIDTPHVRRMGLAATPFERWMLRGRRTKRWMRTLYALRSGLLLRRSLRDASGRLEYWQAGRSVAGVAAVVGAGVVVRGCAAAVRR